MSDRGRAAAWDAGRRFFEVMREQAEPPPDELSWEALSEATRAYYGRVAAAFVAEYRREVERASARKDGTRPPGDEAPRGDDAWGRE